MESKRRSEDSISFISFERVRNTNASTEWLERFSVHLYEKRRDYTRTRMVQLASYLVADTVAGYCTDYIDNESIQAVFEAEEIIEGLAFRQSIPADVMTLLRGWTKGFCPLNEIEQSLSDLIDARRSHPKLLQRG